MDASNPSNLPALAPQNGQLSPLSNEHLQDAVDRAQSALRPFSFTKQDQADLMAELTACLVLVAPATMSQDTRGEFLAIGVKTLNEGNFPAEAIRHGCSVARRKCRKHTDIIAKIVEEAEKRTQWLREDLRIAQGRLLNPPRALAEPEQHDDHPITMDEVRQMTPDLRKMGERAGFIPKALLDAVREEEDRAARQTH